MRAGLTRQALRRHRWAFLGPVATQCVAATVVCTMVTTGMSLNAAPLSRAERQALVAADVPAATAVFALIAVYLAVLLVGVTMNATIARQRKDIALLRAVGATPGQIRRSVVLQAAVVAVPASILGYALGLLTGFVWVAALIDHGIVPPAVRFVPRPAVLAMVLGIGVGTSILGGLFAAVRPARIRPATALTETATARPRGVAVRTGLGLLLFVGGAVLSAVLATEAPEQALDAGFFVILAMCVGVGLLGPVVLRTAVALGRPLLGLAGGAGRLAGDTTATLSRALSGALVPLVLSVAFAAVKVTAHTTAQHVTGAADASAEVWMDYSGTAVYCGFAAVAALNTLLTVAVGRKRDYAVLRLAGATRQRILGVVICEAVIVLFVALTLAAAVAVATLVPLLRAGLHTWQPFLPWSYLLAGIAVTAVVVAAGTIVPAAILTRQPPIAAVEATT
jgi:putative ABC transport system permease protein